MSARNANDAMTEEKKIELLAGLLMSQAWVLVACEEGCVDAVDTDAEKTPNQKPPAEPPKPDAI